MKTFYTSLAVFLVLVTLIVLNSLYIHRTADQIQSLLEEAAPTAEPSEATAALKTLLEKKQRLLGLSVPKERLRELDRALCEMEAALATRALDGYERARLQARAVTEEIKEAECFSIDNLL